MNFVPSPTLLSGLLDPHNLHVPTDLAREPARIPALGGIYGWWFDATLPLVPKEGTLRKGRWSLLYVGIAPSGARGTRRVRTLRDRLKDHSRGPIRTSTLRRTVAALMVGELDLPITRTLNGKLHMPHDAEQRLTAWLGAHARASWMTCAEPWVLEADLIQSELRLPLNIRGSSDPFRAELSALRALLGGGK